MWGIQVGVRDSTDLLNKGSISSHCAPIRSPSVSAQLQRHLVTSCVGRKRAMKGITSLSRNTDTMLASFSGRLSSSGGKDEQLECQVHIPPTLLPMWEDCIFCQEDQ